VKRKREDEVLKGKHNVLKTFNQERTNELAKANAELTKEITQREQVEAALLESEQRSHEQLAELELVYRTAPLGLCHMDTDLRYLRCNEKLAEINGIPAKDHMGRTLREIVPEIAETMESVYHHVIESGNPVVDVVATGATAADPQKVRHFSACYYPVKSEDGIVQGVSSIVQDITERKEAEETLREAHDHLESRVHERTRELVATNAALITEIKQREQAEKALRDLSGHLINAQEEGRRRLARELHDDVSQRLAVLAIEAGKLEQQSHHSPELIHGNLQGMKDQIVKLARDIHRISRQLHPSILDDLGLVDAMESECRRFSELEGIPVKFTADRFPERTPKDVSLCIYRVMQESLRNIAKHAKAREAHVTLTSMNGSVRLMVEDSGVGFDPAKTRGKSGLGLASMEERVRLINGSLSIHSAPGKGTVIEIQAPLAGKDRV